MEIVVSEKTVQEKMEIKPCPWCGSTNLEFLMTEGIGGWYISYYVQCKRCEASGPIHRVGGCSKAKAVQLWNDRL